MAGRYKKVTRVHLEITENGRCFVIIESFKQTQEWRYKKRITQYLSSKQKALKIYLQYLVLANSGKWDCELIQEEFGIIIKFAEKDDEGKQDDRQ